MKKACLKILGQKSGILRKPARSKSMKKIHEGPQEDGLHFQGLRPTIKDRLRRSKLAGLTLLKAYFNGEIT